MKGPTPSYYCMGGNICLNKLLVTPTTHSLLEIRVFIS